MARKGSVTVDVKENDPQMDNAEKDVEDTVVVPKGSSVKGKKTAGKKATKTVPMAQLAEENTEENILTADKEQGDAAEDETEQEPAKAAAQKPKKGAKKAEEVKEKEEEKMPAKRGRKATEKKEEAGDEHIATKAIAEEEEAVPEDPATKGKGGRKPAVSAKGKKGKKEEEAKVEEKEHEVDEEKADEEDKEEEKETKKTAPKAKGGKKAVVAQPDEDVNDAMKEESEEVAVAPKKGRKAAAKSAEDEPETKKQKKDEEKKLPANEDEEVAEKPSGRPKRAAAQKAAAKKIAEEEEEEEEVEKKPKRGAKAATKKTAPKDDDEEEEEEKPAATKRAVKQPAKGRGKGKKAEAVADDEDAPVTSKKPKFEEEEEEEEDMNSMNGGKSMMTKSIRRTVEVKGKAAVDSMCHLHDTSHVHTEGDLIYDVMLNQTNIGNNNNKFYIIQLLKDDKSNKYSVWFRWGRVGYDGQNKLVECGTNLQRAIDEFSKKFEDKTRNDWPTSFDDFETYPGKYTMIEMDYGNGEKDGAANDDEKMQKEQEEEEKTCKVESQLDGRVQNLMHLLCSINSMKLEAKQLEFDADKSPLGKLTQYQIKEGFACLAVVEQFIGKKDFGAQFKSAVNAYYTKIPHACGFRPPQMINTPKILKREIELLELLSGIEYALKTMKEEIREDDVHPADRHYASLKCGLNPIEEDDEEYKLVLEYLLKTHGTTHNIHMGLKNVFKVEREGEDDNEEVMEKIGNRKLLWHGSRMSNFFGILSQGLRIAPPEAPCTGYMFGKGVYFADMATKSGNYCNVSEDGQTGFLLLAEVALGTENQLVNADYNANKLPAGKNSTWGIGRTMPDPSQNKQLNDKVVVPCGQPINSPIGQNAGLLYNEFIVYNTQQIRMRYLVEVQFSFV